MHGLIRRVMPSGSKQWAQTAWILGHGPPIRPRKYPVLSLAEAQVANPKIEGFSELAMNLWRRRPRTHQRSRSASRVIEIRDRNSQSAKHAVQWTAMLGEYVFLVFGLKRVDLEPTSRGFADLYSDENMLLNLKKLNVIRNRHGTKLYTRISSRRQPCRDSLRVFRPQILSTSSISPPSRTQDSAASTSCSGICFALRST